jgi:hypothetical protein
MILANQSGGLRWVKAKRRVAVRPNRQTSLSSGRGLTPTRVSSLLAGGVFVRQVLGEVAVNQDARSHG